MVSVLDLEQYHLRSCDQVPPYSGPPDDTDVSLSTMSISSEDQTIKHARRARLMVWSLSLKGLVGRGGLEPPTSRLSGVRSNQLSYRPDWHPRHRALVGGAYRDRTDDLLNANQALSQLS